MGCGGANLAEAATSVSSRVPQVERYGLVCCAQRELATREENCNSVIATFEEFQLRRKGVLFVLNSFAALVP